MPRRWLEDIALADAAFEAWAATPEELLVESAEAVLEAMAGDASLVERRVRREALLDDSPEFLLVRLLQLQIWHKDAEQLLLHVGPVTLDRGAHGTRWSVRAELWGEAIDPGRHAQGTDVKAVTFHRLFVGQEPDGTWHARVVLDV